MNFVISENVLQALQCQQIRQILSKGESNVTKYSCPAKSFFFESLENYLAVQRFGDIRHEDLKWLIADPRDEKRLTFPTSMLVVTNSYLKERIRRWSEKHGACTFLSELTEFFVKAWHQEFDAFSFRGLHNDLCEVNFHIEYLLEEVITEYHSKPMPWLEKDIVTINGWSENMASNAVAFLRLCMNTYSLITLAEEIMEDNHLCTMMDDDFVQINKSVTFLSWTLDSLPTSELLTLVRVCLG